MACPICRSSSTRGLYQSVSDLEHGTGARASFARCETCGALFQDPAPDPHALKDLYPATYRAANPRGFYGGMKSLAAALLARRLAPHIAPGGSILELGCGAGQLLRAFERRGFSQLTGVDWTIAPARAAAGGAIAFVAHDIASYVPPGPVDAIVLNNVIEHVAAPRALLERYRAYLRPHGRILLITPNAQSLCHRVYGRSWSGLHAPWHVQIFTPRALALLAEGAGLALRALERADDPGGWAISAQTLWRSRTGRGGASGFGWVAALALVVFAPVSLVAKASGAGASLIAVLEPAQRS